MPPHLSSELALQPKSVSMPSVCCDPFGLRGPARLPLHSNRPPPAGQPDKTALLLGRLPNLAMCWAKEGFLLLWNFPGALMRALLMAVAKGAGRPAAATAPWEKGKAPVEGKEELGGEKSKRDGEKLSCNPDHQGCLIPSSLESRSQGMSIEVESFMEDGHVGQCPGPFFHGAKMDKMGLEDKTVPCLRHQSRPSDAESDAERSSDKVMGLQDAECPGSFPQNSLDNLGIKGYFEGSPHEEFEDFKNNLEGDSTVTVDNPSVSQECRESVEHDSGEFVMSEKQSVERTPDSSEDRECLTQHGKAPENLGKPTVSCGFQSSLVLSLFYSPSEEDDDDSEDWSSDGEMEENSQLYLDGAVLETGESSSVTEDNSQHQDFPDHFRESSFLSTDPWHSLCVSKSIQPTTCAPPEPKKHKEITVSFHLRKADSRWLCNYSKPPSLKDQRSATRDPPHQCCLLETERNHGWVTAETSLDSQKESQRIKKKEPEVSQLDFWKGRSPSLVVYMDLPDEFTPSASEEVSHVPVSAPHGEREGVAREEFCATNPQAVACSRPKVRFSPVVTVHTLVVWDYASRAARRGPWEEVARDRCRFQRRIEEVGAILEPCLGAEHRAKAWRKIHGTLDFVQPETASGALHSSVGREKRSF